MKVGDRVGDLRLDSLVGRGGEGEVFAATTMTGGRVAVKVYSPSRWPSRAARRLYLQSAKAMPRVDHSNVAEIIDVGEHDGQVYVVTRFVSGSDYRSVLHSDRLTPETLVESLSAIADGAEHLHRMGLVHRDIKPENIMVSFAGGETSACLVDFGCDYSSTLATRGKRLTPEYAAPEVRAGLPSSASCDVFSLSLVAYQALGGRAWVDDPDNPTSRLWPVLPPPPLPGVRQVVEPLAGAIYCGLAEDPKARPSARRWGELLRQGLDAIPATLRSAPLHRVTVVADKAQARATTVREFPRRP